MTRILVTTIPAWSQRTGSNTFAALLENMEDAQIANLYVRAELPDSPVCCRYFQILEGAVVKTVLNRSIKTGREVQRCSTSHPDSDELKSEKSRYSYFTKKRKPIYLWGREIAWKLGKWKTPELDEFLESFQPDILLFPIESYIYFNRINEYIIKKCNPQKVVGFLWDDNFTYKQSSDISHYISRYFTRKSVARLVEQCDEVLAICPKMKRECDEFFGIDSTIVTKPIRNTPKVEYRYDATRPIRMIYTGSLVIGRDKSLIAVANAIREINKEKQRIYLDIYTSTPLKEEVYRALNIPGCCQIKGSIPQRQVFVEQERADVLVFVESITNKTARLSFSTKITDYLSSNRCILAIGPDDISSMEYFEEQDAAIICNSAESILPALQNIVDHPQVIVEYAEKGYRCGVTNHATAVVTDKIHSVLHLNG